MIIELLIVPHTLLHMYLRHALCMHVCALEYAIRSPRILEYNSVVLERWRYVKSF